MTFANLVLGLALCLAYRVASRGLDIERENGLHVAVGSIGDRLSRFASKMSLIL